MSFEGYYQVLCENGHYTAFDVFDEPEKQECGICGASRAWENLVDQTNGSYDDDSVTRIDGHVDLEMVNDGVLDRCVTCGQPTAVEPPKYRIPEKV